MNTEQWPFVQVDVFAHEVWQGNPVTVFYDVPAQMEKEALQALAREMHGPETLFVTECSDGSRVCLARLFTPERELSSLGHAALGAYYVLQQQGKTQEGLIHLAAAKESVVCHEDDQQWIWMATAPLMVKGLATAVGEWLNQCGLGHTAINGMMPPAWVPSELPQILVFVNSVLDLEKIHVSREHLLTMDQKWGAKGLYALALSGAGAFTARYFSEHYLVAPAAAAMALGSYLLYCAGETQARRFVVTTTDERFSEVHVRLNTQRPGSLEIGGHVVASVRGAVSLGR